MALEEQIASLIAALNANTEALVASTKVRAEAITVAKAATTEAPKPEKATKAAKAEDKAPAAEAPKPEAPAAEEPAAESPYDGLKELVAGYLTATDRQEERLARQEKVIALLKHDRIKKPEVAADANPDISNIAVDAIPLFKDQMRLLKEKGDLTQPASDSLV